MARETLEGVSQLTAQLVELKGLDSGTLLSRCCREAMKICLEQAVRTVPVSDVPTRLPRTYGLQTVHGGYARDSLHIVTKRMVDGKTSAMVSTTKKAFYVTKFEEFGTRHIPPKPWLRQALTSQRDAIESKFRDTLAAGVAKLAAKAQK